MPKTKRKKKEIRFVPDNPIDRATFCVVIALNQMHWCAEMKSFIPSARDFARIDVLREALNKGRLHCRRMERDLRKRARTDV